jgi:hypothetical protein
MRRAVTILAALVVGFVTCLLVVPAAAPQERVRLTPRFEPGQSLRYQMEFRTSTEGSTEGPIEDPQGAGLVEVSVSVVVRFDVLAVTSAPAGSAVRLRATYEKLASTTRGDLADPRAAEAGRDFAALEGRSFEFTLNPSGGVTEVSGIEAIFPEQQAAVREWLAQLSLGVAHPEQGIAPGQSWSKEAGREMTIPLRGYSWQTTSTYVRNEPCRAASEAVAGADETCAVILTRLEVVNRGAPRDPTPDDYRQLGLRTAGSVTGGGESLSFVSLATGLVVSVTQTGAEEFDISVSSADGTTRVRYRGRSRSHTQITLLPEAPPESPDRPAL